MTLPLIQGNLGNGEFCLEYSEGRYWMNVIQGRDKLNPFKFKDGEISFNDLAKLEEKEGQEFMGKIYEYYK